jgi:hypothetical protein
MQPRRLTALGLEVTDDTGKPMHRNLNFYEIKWRCEQAQDVNR